MEWLGVGEAPGRLVRESIRIRHVRLCSVDFSFLTGELGFSKCGRETKNAGKDAEEREGEREKERRNKTSICSLEKGWFLPLLCVHLTHGGSC